MPRLPTSTPDPYSPPVAVVWDVPTRLYHWLQAAIVGAALVTGFFAPEWWLSIHVWLGYGLGGLLLFRLVWGFFGSYHSRFAAFIYSPAEIRAHIRGLVRGRPPHAIGHNPLGAMMVFALIAVIAALLATGLLALGGEEGQGPLAGFAGFSAGNMAREIHALLALAIVALIALHLIGVFVEGRLTRESLVRAMVTGRKRLPAAAREPRPEPARWRPAAIALAAVGGVVFLGGAAASRIPPSGVIAMPEMTGYADECGACHEAYHPSLLPRASWALLVNGLDDHFGEDASLDAETTQAIAAYLQRYASEAWDTEAANRLRVVDDQDPAQITATPFWTTRHGKISAATFQSAQVHGKGNCSACHRDAASGRFDDQMISIPANRQTRAPDQ